MSDDNMVKITELTVDDIRFPTSDEKHGSDAMHTDPDYSAIYVTIFTKKSGNEDGENNLKGHGLAFSLGRGNEVLAECVRALKPLVVGLTLQEITSDFGAFWRKLASDGQLRWLGPEKGAIHMAMAAVINAIWDLWAKSERKPLWRLIVDLTPEQIVSLIDFRWIEDALTKDEALEILRSMQNGKEERIAKMEKDGYPAYTTSAGWLGYSEETLRRLCRDGVKQGWKYFKVKVGQDVEEDKKRLSIIREEIGDDKTIMVDANQRWDVPTAIEWMKELAPHKPWFIEEPTSPDDILGHAAIRKALKPYNVQVATGEACQNRVMFKQMFQAEAFDVCQIDSCRLGGPNEVLAVLLMAAKFKVPVCPHAGGVGLCEYVQHLSMIDFCIISGKLNLIEFVNHLHEHFKYPVRMENAHYQAPMNPDEGYSIEMFPQSVSEYRFPNGTKWQERLNGPDSTIASS